MCKQCNEAIALGNRVFPFRVGNKTDLPYGTVHLLACEKHATWVMEAIREKAQRELEAIEQGG